MKRISSLLLFFLFISCVGQNRTNRQISNSHPKNYDCKTLFKKQKLQYKLAIWEDKVNQRSRKSAMAEKHSAMKRNEVTTEKVVHTSLYLQKNISMNVGPLLFANRLKTEDIGWS